MKTGRPGYYYIPTPQTVLRDVKQVFVKSRQASTCKIIYHSSAYKLYEPQQGGMENFNCD